MCGIIHTRRDSLPYIKEELRLGKDLKGKELGQGIVQKKSGRYEARYVDRFGKRISISGKEESLARIRKGIELLQANV